MGTIGSRIRELRKAHDLTQVALAKAVGIDQSTLSDIERGVGFSAETLVRLAAELDSSAEYIMTGAQSRSWPFSIDIERFLSLSEKQQGIVEGKLIAAIEDCEERPTEADRKAFRPVNLRTTTKALGTKKVG